MTGPSPSHVPSDDVLGRERQALELRRAGLTFDAIADQLGYNDRGAAHKAFKRALARTLQQPAAEVRDLEIDRLDKLQVQVWAKAIRGELGAIDRVLRISERRARLIGLDHTDGIAERQMQLAEHQGRQLAQVIQRVLDRIGLTPEQQEVVPVVVVEELRTVAELEAGGGA